MAKTTLSFILELPLQADERVCSIYNAYLGEVLSPNLQNIDLELPRVHRCALGGSFFNEELAIAQACIEELTEQLVSALDRPAIDPANIDGALTTLLKFGRLKLETLSGEIQTRSTLSSWG